MSKTQVLGIIAQLDAQHDLPNLAALRPVYLESLVSAAVERDYPLSELDVADGLMSDCEAVQEVLDEIAAKAEVQAVQAAAHWALIESWLQPGALAA